MFSGVVEKDLWYEMVEVGIISFRMLRKWSGPRHSSGLDMFKFPKNYPPKLVDITESWKLDR